jgi:hypothetical protein
MSRMEKKWKRREENTERSRWFTSCCFPHFRNGALPFSGPFRHSQTKRHRRAGHGSHNPARHFLTRSRIRAFSGFLTTDL